MRTKVIFRKYKSNGDILALFPELPGNHNGDACLSYEHVGQHGAASIDGLIAACTLPAKPDEYEPLKRELEQIGYELQVLKRTCRKHRLARMEAVNTYR